MKTLPFIAFSALALTATIAWSANNQGGAGSLNQVPTAGTTNPMSPNAGSTPTPGFQTGNTPATGAGANNGDVSNVRQAGPGNPATEAQRSTAVEILFSPGESAISALAKQKIDQTLREARARGQITRVNVIGWGDVAYPDKNQSVPDAQKQLAAKRSLEIENYIQSRNNGLAVDSINMTERPSALQDLLNGSDARTKKTLENAGLSGGGASRGSRAMVMVIVR